MFTLSCPKWTKNYTSNRFIIETLYISGRRGVILLIPDIADMCFTSFAPTNEPIHSYFGKVIDHSCATLFLAITSRDFVLRTKYTLAQ